MSPVLKSFVTCSGSNLKSALSPNTSPTRGESSLAPLPSRWVDGVALGGGNSQIADFISQTEIVLNPGDVVVLYTDGITEAENIHRVQYGLERLCQVVQRHWQSSAPDIRQAAINDLLQHIGDQKVFDDITIMVLKQK